MAHWSTDISGLHEAIDFLERWWLPFFAAPFFLTPLMVFLSLSARPSSARRAKGKTRDDSKSRRSLSRRLFVDDSVTLTRRAKIAPLFAGSFFVAASVSILVFLAVATGLVVRALLLVNTTEMQ